MPFARPEANQMPELACLGQVGEVSEPKLTGSGVYYWCGIRLVAQDAGRDRRAGWMYRPEWLAEDFDASGLPAEKGNNLKFIYEKHIAAPPKSLRLSVIEGLAGSAEGFAELSTSLNDLQRNGGADPADVKKTLEEYFGAHEPTVGYILGQKKEDGQLVDDYEVTRYFWPTSESIARMVRRADQDELRAKSGGESRRRFILCFEAR